MTANRVNNTTTGIRKDGMPFIAESLCVGTGQAIENQEREGQARLCQSSVLPTDYNHHNELPEILKAWGVKFLHVVVGDPVFQTVELPAGWSIKPTDHSMWTKLVDDRGRERASIFYKAAFYDRSAHMRLKHAVTLENEFEKNVEWFEVKLHGKTVFKGETFEGYRSGALQSYDERKKPAREVAETYLKAHYPDHDSYTAYWDAECPVARHGGSGTTSGENP